MFLDDQLSSLEKNIQDALKDNEMTLVSFREFASKNPNYHDIVDVMKFLECHMGEMSRDLRILIRKIQLMNVMIDDDDDVFKNIIDFTIILGEISRKRREKQKFIENFLLKKWHKK